MHTLFLLVPEPLLLPLLLLLAHQALKDEFAEKEPQLDAIQSLGNVLADYSGPTTSSEAVRAKLSDTSTAWKDLLEALDRREAVLRTGWDRAKDYSDRLRDFMQWLQGVEAELEEPEKMDGDPRDISKQLTKTKVGGCLDECVSEGACWCVGNVHMRTYIILCMYVRMYIRMLVCMQIPYVLALSIVGLILHILKMVQHVCICVCVDVLDIVLMWCHAFRAFVLTPLLTSLIWRPS